MQYTVLISVCFNTVHSIGNLLFKKIATVQIWSGSVAHNLVDKPELSAHTHKPAHAQTHEQLCVV